MGARTDSTTEVDQTLDAGPAAPRVSSLASDLLPSEILRIAADVRAMMAEAAGGEPGAPAPKVCNLTVGDFSPSEFRIPKALEDGVAAALRDGQTNYPPSSGIETLRSAVRDFYAKRLGLDYPTRSVLIMAGARPAIYAAFRALVDPGDRVVYPVPSWNNNHYTYLVGGRPVPVACGADTNFQPTAGLLRQHLRGARLLTLNSPLNPTGTLFDAETLGEISDAVLEENARRGTHERPLYVLYDQVYWMLTFGGAKHVNPVSLRPEMARYTIHVDAISKAFAATGLRVGWSIAPDDVTEKMSDLSAHLGAWAPKPEQVATAQLLRDDAAVDQYLDRMRPEVQRRLAALGDGIAALQADGFPVESTSPQGAIYLSARFALHGWRAPAVGGGSGEPRAARGSVLTSNDDIRRYLLRAAGFAAVPFQAFGSSAETGWFRLSAGAVSTADIQAVMPRLREALGRLERD